MALWLALAACVVSPAMAERLAVIASPRAAIHAVDRTLLARIYRSKVLVDDQGHRIVPINLPAGNAVREAFSAAVLGRPSRSLQSYWNEQYFHGIRPPVVMESEEAVLRFVATTEGALGYVADCHVDARVRVIGHVEVAFSSPAASGCPPP